jgi:hypothetical protein
MHFPLRRKGMSPVVFLLMAFVIAGLYLIVTVFILKKPIATAGALFSEEIRKADAKECQRLYEQFLAQGVTEPPDTDKDGFPNRCDFCYGKKPDPGQLIGNDGKDDDLDGIPGQLIGNDGKDDDLDGIPDSCDNDIDGPPKRGTSLASICNQDICKKDPDVNCPNLKDGGTPYIKGTWNKNRNRCDLQA